MDVLTLSTSNFNGLSTNYPYDSTIEIKTGNYRTYDGLSISIIDGLNSALDTTINNYTSFILSNKINVNTILDINRQQITYPYLLTTYLGIYTAENITFNSKVLNTGIDIQSKAAYPIGFTQYEDATNHRYTVNFIDKDTCTISQIINSSVYYFSYFQCNSGISQFVMVSGYQEDENNLFNYYYDTDLSQLVLTKKVFGLQNYVSYTNGEYLTMTQFVTGSDVYVNGSGFKIAVYENTDLGINSDWYSYVKNIDIDGLQVNNERCVDNVPLNYLFNVTPELLSNNTLPIDFIPLKNDKDSSNSLSRGSILDKRYDGVIQRSYTSLNTGSNQLKGSPDFNLGYNSYTTQLQVLKDNITFFYFPYEPFPVIQLNINDSSLVESGAIAGDRPANSDKVFKHKVIEDFAKQYNSNNTEQTGTYLCSWLKGGNTLSALPIWVDRYYNPSLIGSIDALTYTDAYLTDFELLSATNSIPQTTPLYDIVSNLTFEPGYQYAIQHLGDTNIIELIDTLSANLIQNNIDNRYDYLNQYFEHVGNEIVLGKKYYSTILTDKQIADIKQYSNFTINVDIGVSNWNNRIGYQILGNYNTYGFGIFNDQQITPFVITFSGSVIYIYNTQLSLLDTVDVDTNIIHLSKLDPVGNILTITSDNYVTRIDYNSVIVDKKIIPNIGDYDTHYSTIEYTYCYSSLLSTIKINNSSLDYEYIANTGKQIVVTNTVTTETTFIEIDNVTYIIPGSNIKSNKDIILFTVKNSQGQFLCLYEISIDKTSILFTTDKINDYIINSNNTIYLLYNDNTLLLTDTEYRIQTSNNFPVVLFADQPSLSGNTYLGLDTIQNIDGSGIAETGLVFIGFNSSRTTKYIIITNKIENGEIIDINKSVEQTITSTQVSGYHNVTNSNFNRCNLTDVGQLEFRLGLPNVYDKTNILLYRYIHDITTLEPGSHTFTIRFDSVNGVYTIFIDGIKHKEFIFQGGQYSFSSIIDKKLYVGNCIYYNNKSLGFYVNQPTYYITDTLVIKNFYLYNVALSYYDLLLFVKLNYLISNILFQLPTGKRNYIETIQQFFKFKVPGFKSNYFNVHVVNLPVTGILKERLDTIFNTVINKNKPGYTELNKITYHE